MASNCVNFVDEDNARSVLFALLKEVANAAGAHADKHLDKVRSGDAEERNVGLAGYSARQQGLAGSRMADQQDALGNASTKLLKLLRFAQELDDFSQLLFGLVHAGH